MNEIFQKYSALISIYNKEKPKFLDEALNSMSEQTVLPSQVVIVEDGPLSESLLDIIRKFRDIFINKNIDVTIVKNKKIADWELALTKEFVIVNMKLWLVLIVMI